MTAGDSGIGKATAVALAKAGMDVAVTWHSDDQGAEETAEEIRSHGGEPSWRDSTPVTSNRPESRTIS